MRLSLRQDELMQRYVDGCLFGLELQEAEYLLQQEPAARTSLARYREVLASLDDDHGLPLASESFIDSVMESLPQPHWTRRFFSENCLILLSAVSMLVAVLWLYDHTPVTQWLALNLRPGLESLSSISGIVATVLEPLDRYLPYLIGATLVAAFYGLLDRILAARPTATRLMSL